MISTAQSATSGFIVDPQNIPSAARTWSIDVLPSRDKNTYSTPVISLVNLLTANHILHSLEKTIDDLEGLRRSYPSLILSEPIQPLKYRLDVLLPQELLLDSFYAA